MGRFEKDMKQTHKNRGRVNSAIAAAIAACLLTVTGCAGNVFGDPASGGAGQDNKITDESENSGVDSAVEEDASANNDDTLTGKSNIYDDGDTLTEEVNDSENASEESNKGAADKAEADQGEDQAVNSEGEEAGDQNDTHKDTELYESFLKNEVTVLVKNENSYGVYWDLDNLKNMDVTLEGLVNGILSYYSDGTDFKASLEGIDYAYIDCGNDGNKELALHIKTPQGNETWEEYIIIKNVDGVLETIFSTVAWSRSSVYIGEYGYIFGDGSGGAASHIFDKSFIDGDGKWHYIYEDSSDVGILPDASIYINGDSYNIPKDIKLDGDYVLLQFDLNNTESDASDDLVTYAKIVDGSDGDWESGFRGYFYADLEDDNSIYDDSHPLKKFFDKEGLKLYTLDEIDKMIAEKEASEGLTDEVKNGADADWQPLELSFSPQE